MTQNVIDGKKRIILNGNPQQKSDLGTHAFEEGEVYGVDVLVSTNKDNKVGYWVETSENFLTLHYSQKNQAIKLQCSSVQTRLTFSS